MLIKTKIYKLIPKKPTKPEIHEWETSVPNPNYIC